MRFEGACVTPAHDHKVLIGGVDIRCDSTRHVVNSMPTECSLVTPRCVYTAILMVISARDVLTATIANIAVRIVKLAVVLHENLAIDGVIHLAQMLSNPECKATNG